VYNKKSHIFTSERSRLSIAIPDWWLNVILVKVEVLAVLDTQFSGQLTYNFIVCPNGGAHSILVFFSF
jgi:hypothetical protein